MPTIVNTYTDPNVSLGKSLEDLGNSMWGPQAAAADYAKQKARGAARNNAAEEALMNAARGPNGLDFNDATTRAAAVGAENPDRVFQAQRGIQANRYGADSSQATNAYVGAGGSAGSTFQGMREQEANARSIAQMNADKAAKVAVYQADNTPQNVIVDGQPQITSRSAAISGHMRPVLSDSDTTGYLKDQNFGKLDQLNDNQQKALGAYNSPDHVYNYVAPGADGQVMTGRTVDGKTDLTTGKPLDARSQLVASSNQGGTNVFSGAFGPQQKEQGDARAQYQSAKDLGDIADFAHEMAVKSPLIVGATGNMTRLGQNVGNIAQNIAQAVGRGSDYESSLNNIRQQLDQQTGGKGAMLLPELYNPKIDLLDQVHGMLVYKYAEGVFGQSGRDLSDRDVHQARIAVGDPSSWLQSPQAFQNAMRTVSSVARQKQAQAEYVLKNGSIVGAPSIISGDMRQRAGLQPPAAPVPQQQPMQQPAQPPQAPAAPQQGAQPDLSQHLQTGQDGVQFIDTNVGRLYLRNGQWSKQ